MRESKRVRAGAGTLLGVEMQPEQLREEFFELAGSKLLITALRAEVYELRLEVERLTMKWNGIQSMVQANGFRSVGSALVEIDKLRDLLGKQND